MYLLACISTERQFEDTHSFPRCMFRPNRKALVKLITKTFVTIYINERIITTALIMILVVSMLCS